jgi:hypothetical protein
LADFASPPRFWRCRRLRALGYLDHAPLMIQPTRGEYMYLLARRMVSQCCICA